MDFDNKNFNYQWQKYANRSVDWYCKDSEKTYNFNLKYKYDQLQLYGWVDKKINYKFNSEGYRCSEFSQSDSIMFFGCSFTLGVGVPLENTYPFITAENLKLECKNYGVSGSSSNTAFRLAYTAIEKYKPKIAVVYLIFPSRLELLCVNESLQYGVNNHGDRLGFYKDWLMAKENSVLNQEKNILAINKLCDFTGTKFIDLSPHILPLTDKGRDLMHPGIKYHKTLSDKLLTLI